MSFMKLNFWSMLIGCALDLLLGDPEGWPHPVIWIGRWIRFAEKHIRKRFRDLRVGAVWLTASTVALTVLVTVLLVRLLRRLGTVFALVGMSVLAWTCLSGRCLAKESRGVLRALEQSLDAGRKQVGRIVGRDTAELSEAEILRATVETVAENTTDGVISPMLYLFFGGPVLAMGFKAVSTLDSMVGYLDEKYRDIGWSSAKLDDVLNYIPARLTGFGMCLAARLIGLDGKNALRILRRDHGKHLSPNCAWSEAAAAGALHIRLGGAHRYFGREIEKPTIGDDDRPIEKADILRANRLMWTVSGLFLLILTVLEWLL